MIPPSTSFSAIVYGQSTRNTTCRVLIVPATTYHLCLVSVVLRTKYHLYLVSCTWSLDRWFSDVSTATRYNFSRYSRHRYTNTKYTSDHILPVPVLPWTYGTEYIRYYFMGTNGTIPQIQTVQNTLSTVFSRYKRYFGTTLHLVRTQKYCVLPPPPFWVNPYQSWNQNGVPRPLFIQSRESPDGAASAPRASGASARMLIR